MDTAICSGVAVGRRRGGFKRVAMGRRLRPRSVFTSDRFTGGDLTNLEGRSTDFGLGGTAKTWQANTAPSGVGIVSGRMRRTSGSSQRRLGFDAGTGNVWLRAKVYEEAGVYGAPILQIRRTDVTTTATDHYKVECGTNGIPLLRKNVGGVNSTVYTHPQAVPGGTELGVFATGDRVGITINGIVVCLFVDTDVAASRTWFAVQVQTQTVLVDDIIISEL